MQAWLPSASARTQKAGARSSLTSVPHDVAQERIKAALDAGGTLVSDERAPAFWVLADADGNKACICTWESRD